MSGGIYIKPVLNDKGVIDVGNVKFNIELAKYEIKVYCDRLECSTDKSLVELYESMVDMWEVKLNVYESWLRLSDGLDVLGENMVKLKEISAECGVIL